MPMCPSSRSDLVPQQKVGDPVPRKVTLSPRSQEMSPSRQERQKGVLSPSTEQPESKSCPQAGGRSAEGGSEHEVMMPEGPIPCGVTTSCRVTPTGW